jgi:hypothetical protein
MSDDERDEFSVYAFKPSGLSHLEVSFAGAREAAICARRLTETIAAKEGEIARIIITDGGDHTCFEWRYGAGVTFPGPEAASL